MKIINGIIGSLTLTLTLAASLQAQDPFTNGLVAYYPFNGNANDESENQKDGTAVGAVLTADRLGRPERAYSFNSQGQYVVVTNSLHPKGQVTLTYSCWIKRNYTTALHQSIINVATFSPGTKFHSNTRSEFGLVQVNNTISPVYTGEGNDFNSPLTQIIPDKWCHLVLTKDETNISVYINGVFHANGSTLPGQNVTSDKLFIGWNGNISHLGGEQFFGAIDDVRIYNRALSADEVHSLYLYESGPLVILLKAVKPSFSRLAIGTNYQMQISSDMVNWANEGTAFTATSETMVYPQYFDVENFNKLFFRVQIAP